MSIKRRKSRVVKVQDVLIGGNHPVAIQSMLKSATYETGRAIAEINRLKKVGCEIVRVAVKDEEDARAIRVIKKAVRMPLVADIHFHWRLAIKAIENGADKIRLNPGNIFKRDEIRQVVSALKMAKLPLRIGLNSGSVKYSGSRRVPMADKLVMAALDYIKKVEKMKFYDIVISLKASSVLDTVAAYRKLGKLCDYPLHLGVTATGSPFVGAVKSSIALGSLLLDGIGDTIRVSLTDVAENEIKAAKAILESLELRKFGPELISCPTCGRCQVNLFKIVKELEDKLSTIDYGPLTHSMKIAIMGCMVNGPGEAREADIGVAFGKNKGILFRAGKAEKTLGVKECLEALLKGVKSPNV